MKAQMGIGALIVFIAFVLTAAIAAFLVTQTTVSTQQKAAAVADQARERTGTTLEIVRVEGLVNQTANVIDRYIVYTRLAPGSSPINLETTTIAYYTKDGREILSYNGTLINETQLPTTGDGHYYLLKAYSSYKGLTLDSIFEAGELYAIGFTVNNTLSPSDTWRITFIPREGMPAEAYGIAPDVFVDKIVILR